MSGSDVKELEKKVNGDLRKAQNNMFSGKNEEAWNMIEEIWTDIEKIRSIDPSYPSISRLERTHSKLKGDLERKLGRGQATVSAPVKSPPPPTRRPPTLQTSSPSTPAVNKVDPNKLPAGVTKRLNDLEKLLQRAEEYLNSAESLSKLENVGYDLKSATSIYEEIGRMYGDYANHTEVQAVSERITQLTAKLNTLNEKAEAEKEAAAKIKEQVEAESNEWVQKIRPYLSGSGDFEKRLELSRIRGKDNLIHQAQLLEEAKALLKEYNSHNWSNGKTWDLEQAEKNLIQVINDGEETYNGSIDSVISEAASLINDKIAWFDTDSGWRTDETKKPKWLYTADKKAIDERMAAVEELVPDVITDTNSGFLELKNQLAKLTEMNRERLDIIPKRTHMLTEQYVGDDNEVIKSAAAELVKQKEHTASVLKVHLIKEDWSVEDVIEHTDSTKTAIQHRVTYHLPAQVAAQVGDQTLLYTAHIAKNRRPDGSFGGLYGNLEDYPDRIAPENIPK